MRFKLSINKKEALAAGLLCLFGLAAALQVSASSVSRISGMGAGVLPVVLGSLLMFIGVLWLFDSRLSPDEEDDADIGSSKWRACCGLVSGVFACLMLVRYGGAVPAIFALVFVSALGDCKHSVRSAFLLSTCATAVAALGLWWWPAASVSLFSWR